MIQDSPTNPQHDIRIGTLVQGRFGADKTADYIRQIVPHGFESFQITMGAEIADDINLKEMAKKVLDACGDAATISSLGVFGNPLQNEATAKSLEKAIKAAPLFGANIVAGFTGAIEGEPVPGSMPAMKKVWGKLSKLAESKGVRIAWENCDMGGNWNAPKYNIAHAPTAWEMIFNELPSDALGLEWEPCHQMVSLIDPLPQLRKWMPKVFHLHGKDATIAWDVLREKGLRGGQPWIWHRMPGMGDTNWSDVITILRQHNFTGAIDIEGWHDPVYRGELEMTGQVHGLNYLKRCRGGEYVPNPA
jgi:sugar phosphate isomerase/epimerase